jgi:hypothetical protein
MNHESLINETSACQLEKTFDVRLSSIDWADIVSQPSKIIHSWKWCLYQRKISEMLYMAFPIFSTRGRKNGSPVIPETSAGQYPWMFCARENN